VQTVPYLNRIQAFFIPLIFYQPIAGSEMSLLR
jgi:hypothetical protein